MKRMTSLCLIICLLFFGIPFAPLYAAESAGGSMNEQGLQVPVISYEQLQQETEIKEDEFIPIDEHVKSEIQDLINPAQQNPLQPFDAMEDALYFRDTLESLGFDGAEMSRQDIAAAKLKLAEEMTSLFSARDKIFDYIKNKMDEINEEYPVLNDLFVDIAKSVKVDGEVVVKPATIEAVNDLYAEANQAIADTNTYLSNALIYMAGWYEYALRLGESTWYALEDAEASLDADEELTAALITVQKPDRPDFLTKPDDITPELYTLEESARNQLIAIRGEVHFYLEVQAHRDEVQSAWDQASADALRLSEEIFPSFDTLTLENLSRVRSLPEGITDLQEQIEDFLNQATTSRSLTTAQKEAAEAKIREIGEWLPLPVEYADSLALFLDPETLGPEELYNSYADWLDRLFEEQDGLLNGIENEEDLDTVRDYFYENFINSLANYEEQLEGYALFAQTPADAFDEIFAKFSLYQDYIQDALMPPIELFLNELAQLESDGESMKAQIEYDTEYAEQLEAALQKEQNQEPGTGLRSLKDALNYFYDLKGVFDEITISEIPESTRQEYSDLKVQAGNFAATLPDIEQSFMDAVDHALADAAVWLDETGPNTLNLIYDYLDALKILTADDERPALPSLAVLPEYPEGFQDAIDSIIEEAASMRQFYEEYQRIISLRQYFSAESAFDLPDDSVINYNEGAHELSVVIGEHEIIFEVNETSEGVVLNPISGLEMDEAEAKAGAEEIVTRELPILSSFEGIEYEESPLSEHLAGVTFPEGFLATGFLEGNLNGEELLGFYTGIDTKTGEVRLLPDEETGKILGADEQVVREHESAVQGETAELADGNGGLIFVVDGPDHGTVSGGGDNALIYTSEELEYAETQNSIADQVTYAELIENPDGSYSIEIHREQVEVYEDQAAFDNRPPDEGESGGGSGTDFEFTPTALAEHLTELEQLNPDGDVLTGEEIEERLVELYELLEELGQEMDALPGYATETGEEISARITEISELFDELIAASKNEAGETVVSEETAAAMNELAQEAGALIDKAYAYADEYSKTGNARYREAAEKVLAYIDALEASAKELSENPGEESVEVQVGDAGDGSITGTLPDEPLDDLAEIKAQIEALTQQAIQDKAFNEEVTSFRDDVFETYNDIASTASWLETNIQRREELYTELSESYRQNVESLPELKQQLIEFLTALSEDSSLTSAQREQAQSFSTQAGAFDTTISADLDEFIEHTLADSILVAPRQTLTQVEDWLKSVDGLGDQLNLIPKTQEELDAAIQFFSTYKSQAENLMNTSKTYENLSDRPEGPYDNRLEEIQALVDKANVLNQAKEDFENGLTQKAEQATNALAGLNTSTQALEELSENLAQEIQGGQDSKTAELEALMNEFIDSLNEFITQAAEETPSEFDLQRQQLIDELENLRDQFVQMKQDLQDAIVEKQEDIADWLEQKDEMASALEQYLAALQDLAADDPMPEFPAPDPAPVFPEEFQEFADQIQDGLEKIENFSDRFEFVQDVRDYLLENHGFELPEGSIMKYDEAAKSLSMVLGNLSLKFSVTGDPAGEYTLTLTSGLEIDQAGGKSKADQLIAAALPAIKAVVGSFDYAYSPAKDHLNQLNLPVGFIAVQYLTASTHGKPLFGFWTALQVSTGNLQVIADPVTQIHFGAKVENVSQSFDVAAGKSVDLGAGDGSEVFELSSPESGSFFSDAGFAMYLANDDITIPGGAESVEDNLTWVEFTGCEDAASNCKALLHSSKVAIFPDDQTMQAKAAEDQQKLSKESQSQQDSTTRDSAGLQSALGGGGSMAGSDPAPRETLGLGQRPLEKDPVMRKLGAMFKSWALGFYEEMKNEKTQKLAEDRQRRQQEIFKG